MRRSAVALFALAACLVLITLLTQNTATAQSNRLSYAQTPTRPVIATLTPTLRLCPPTTPAAPTPAKNSNGAPTPVRTALPCVTLTPAPTIMPITIDRTYLHSSALLSVLHPIGWEVSPDEQKLDPGSDSGYSIAGVAMINSAERSVIHTFVDK